MMRTWTSAVAIAAFVILVLTMWPLTKGGGPQPALAMAMDGVKKARTLSFKQVLKTTRDGEEKIVDETLTIFKAPDVERRVILSGVSPQFIGQVTITHYGKRRRLTYKPVTKTASFTDMRATYVVDPSTGSLKRSQLDTSIRDRLLKYAARPAKDLGQVELDGQLVRLLESRKGKRIFRVWAHPKTGLPVQIAIDEPEHQQRWLYTSIRFGEELDDRLFSLELPDGYGLFGGGRHRPPSDHVGKMVAKMMYLLNACHAFAGNHNDRYPKKLAELKIPDHVLKVILAAPDQPDGPAVIGYRPRKPDMDWSAQVILYEKFEEWPPNGLVVGIAAGHCEVIVEQTDFKKLTR